MFNLQYKYTKLDSYFVFACNYGGNFKIRKLKRKSNVLITYSWDKSCNTANSVKSRKKK